MADSTFPLAPAGVVASRVVDVINGTGQTWLRAFFGPNPATLATVNEAALPVRAPGIVVIPEAGPQARLIGGDVRADVPVVVRAYLPPDVPATQRYTAPVALTVASGTTSATYRLTAIFADGQSFAGAASVTRAGSGVPTFTLPTPAAGQLAWGVWRAEAGRTYYRLAMILPVASGTFQDPYTEAQLGDAMAPILGVGDVVRQALVEALFATDTEELPDSSDHTLAAFAALALRLPLPTLISRRNLVAWDVGLTYPTVYDPRTGAIQIGHAA